MEKRLYRSREDRMIWGVCGGLGKYLGIDATVVRIITVLLTVASGGLGILAYIAIAIVVPLEESKASTPRETVQQNVAEMRETATELGQQIRSTLKGEAGDAEKEAQVRRGRLNLVGIILIVVGLIFLVGSFKLLWWFDWVYLWPLIIVAIGVIILITAGRK